MVRLRCLVRCYQLCYSVQMACLYQLHPELHLVPAIFLSTDYLSYYLAPEAFHDVDQTRQLQDHQGHRSYYLAPMAYQHTATTMMHLQRWMHLNWQEHAAVHERLLSSYQLYS